VSISVLLADDQPLLRRGFRMIIEAEGDLTVTAEAGNGDEAVGLARRSPPDVVLMDIRMPGCDGIEATRRIIAADPSVRVLVLTTFDLDEYAFGALRAGASGFLLKDVHPAELVAAIRTVASGNAVVSPRVTRRLLEEYAQVPVLSPAQRADRYPQLSSLTEREGEVLTAVARGLSNAEIAAALHVSDATVKSHVGRILAKLGLRDRVQVVVLAYEAGIVRPGTLTPPEAGRLLAGGADAGAPDRERGEAGREDHHGGDPAAPVGGRARGPGEGLRVVRDRGALADPGVGQRPDPGQQAADGQREQQGDAGEAQQVALTGSMPPMRPTPACGS
jgi:DNA-binding NarL/FixJ family response regulator